MLSLRGQKIREGDPHRVKFNLFMSRSVWKKGFFESFFFKQVKTKKSFYIWSRRSVIPQSLIGFTVFVYNGKIFRKLKISRDKVGFKFGFFISTRNRFVVKKQKKR